MPDDTPAPHALGGSIADRVADTLREDILTGALAPGARLKLLDLAARYGVSPLPVREALRRLEGERLLVAQSHRGATVRLLTAKMIGDLYELRETLEALLAERAARRCSEAGRRGLHALADRWETAAAQGAVPLLEANRAFHARIAEIGDNPEVADAATRGFPLIVALRGRFGFSAHRLAEIAAQHRALVAAIGAGDAAQAGAVARAHVVSARDELLARLVEAGLPGLVETTQLVDLRA